jgi:hypothetical protein
LGSTPWLAWLSVYARKEPILAPKPISRSKVLGLRPTGWAAVVCASSFLVAVATLLWRNWIETVLGVDPDHGTGSLEWAMVALAFAVASILLGYWAKNSRAVYIVSSTAATSAQLAAADVSGPPSAGADGQTVRDPDDFEASTARFELATQQMRETPLTAHLISSLSDEELDDLIWIRLWSRPGLLTKAGFAQLRPTVRAYCATRIFEWQVGNGGVYQFFLNWESEPWLVAEVIRGYNLLGLRDQRRLIEEFVAPTATLQSEIELREQNRAEPRGGTGERSQLNQFDQQVGDHTAERLRLLRTQADDFIE